jgi:predicted permease
MENLAVIIVCFLIGVLIKSRSQSASHFHEGLNAFIIYLALPAVSLKYLPQLQFSIDFLLPFLTGWIVLIGSLILFKNFKFIKDRGTLGALILVAGLGNVSFLGFPIVEYFYGKEGLQLAVLVDQGSFLALSTSGVSVAMIYSGVNIQYRVIGKRVLSFPPFIAFLMAIILNISEISLPSWTEQSLGILASTLTPVALTSIGMQFSFQMDILDRLPLLAGLLYKMIIAPLMIFFIGWFFFEIDMLPTKVSVIEASMPPMVTAAIIASRYNLNPKLANSLVAIGLVVAVMVLPLWRWILG